MSRTNVEMARHGMALYSAYLRDQSDAAPLEEMLRAYAPDAEIDFSRTLPDLPPGRGPEAMRAWNDTLTGLFSEVSLCPGRYRAVGDAVVVGVRVRARGSASGVTAQAAFAYLFRIVDARVVAATTFRTEAEALDSLLRAARAGDEPFLTELVRLAAGWRDDAPAPLTPELERYAGDFGRPGDHGVVAVSAGAAWVRLLPGGYGFVADDVPELAMAVMPAARGAGLGGALLSRLIADAAALGHPALSLSVEPDNPARRLYERHGFEKVGESGGAWTMWRRARL